MKEMRRCTRGRRRKPCSSCDHPTISSRSASMAFRTADVADLTAAQLAGYDVVFLAALVGVAEEEKAALVVRSAHGARGFLYPVVDPEDIGRGGFEVLAVYHPDDEIINSVIVVRKVVDGNGRSVSSGTVPVVSPPCKCCKMEAGAAAAPGMQKRAEMASREEVSF
ncbi:unnamed protein product [Urochloa humidicola]